MRVSFGTVILMLVSLSFSKNVSIDSLVKYIEFRERDETQLVNISYISKRSISAVDVICRAHVPSFYLKIICPVLDDVSFENSNFGVSRVDGRCEFTDDNSNDPGCSQIVRRISSKLIGNFTNFVCFCLVKIQGVENDEITSVNITNHECNINNKTVVRRKVNEEKNIRLTCCISGFPHPQITWYKDEVALVLPSGSTAKNNVGYLQKSGDLLISRTDVNASGSYHCLGINPAGNERGGNYEVIFYGTEANMMNKSKPQHTINSNHFTGLIHPETTKIATTFPHFDVISKDAKGETAAKFVPMENGTVDNKEEEEENKKKYTTNTGAYIGLLAVTCSVVLIISITALVYTVIHRRKNLSTDLERSRLSAMILRDARQKSADAHDDSIDDKLVRLKGDLESTPPGVIMKPFGPSGLETAHAILHSDTKAEFNLYESLITCPGPSIFPARQEFCGFSSSHKDNNDFCAEPCTVFPTGQSTSAALNVDTTYDYDNTEERGKVVRKSSNQPSPDPSTSSDTSVFFDKLIEIPPNSDQRYFTSSLIDHNGGEVVLVGTGIKLVIPEGAINFGKTEVVFLALIGNPEFIPKSLNDDESLLAPVLMCGPHGLRFKKYVLLILPHCVAVSDEMQKTFRVLCSNTSPEMTPEWEEVFNQNEEPNKDVFCYMREQHFSLFLLHFSWYTIAGEDVQARNFSVTAYHTSFHQENEDFKVRVYFIPIMPNSIVAQQKVDKSEKKLQGRLSDGQKVKTFRKDGGDIKVEATGISEGWELVDENSFQTTGYKELCHINEESPNHTFCFQHVNPRPERISCRFKVFQDNCEFDTPVNIIVSQHFEAEIKKARLENNIASITSIASTSGYAGSGESTSVSFIPTTLRKDLIQLLDIDNNPAINDWKILADNLGYNLQFIQWLDVRSFKTTVSPTQSILMEWENDVKESPVDALRYLQSVLEKMKREDAASKIREYLMSLIKETTV